MGKETGFSRPGKPFALFAGFAGVGGDSLAEVETVVEAADAAGAAGVALFLLVGEVQRRVGSVRALLDELEQLAHREAVLIEVLLRIETTALGQCRDHARVGVFPSE